MPSKYDVRLSSGERADLERAVHSGTHHARYLEHARILLLTDAAAPCDDLPDGGPAWSDDKVADALGCGASTVARTRRRFVNEGLAAALRVRRPAPGPPREIDGAAEAHLIALACSAAPGGRATWSLRLLADEFSALGVAAGWIDGPVSYEVVRRALKKTTSPTAPTLAPTAPSRT